MSIHEKARPKLKKVHRHDTHHAPTMHAPAAIITKICPPVTESVPASSTYLACALVTRAGQSCGICSPAMPNRPAAVFTPQQIERLRKLGEDVCRRALSIASLLRSRDSTASNHSCSSCNKSVQVYASFMPGALVSGQCLRRQRSASCLSSMTRGCSGDKRACAMQLPREAG